MKVECKKIRIYFSSSESTLLFSTYIFFCQIFIAIIVFTEFNLIGERKYQLRANKVGAPCVIIINAFNYNFELKIVS